MENPVLWRYAVSGAAVVGGIGGVLAVSMTLPGMIATPDRTVGSAQSAAPSTPGSTPNRGPTQSKPPPPDLLAAQKAAEEAQQAIAAINRQRAAEEKVIAEMEAKAKADDGSASSPVPAQGPGLTPGQAPEPAQGQAMPAPPSAVPPPPTAPAGGTAPPGGGPPEAAPNNSTTADAALQAQRDALEQQVKQLMAQIQQEKDRLSALRSDTAPSKVAAAKPSHPEPRQNGRQTDFASVEQIVARLRQEQGYTLPPTPNTAPPAAAPPVPRNVLPLTTAEDMLPLRTAQLEITAGDTARAVSIMASVQARMAEQGGGDAPPPQVRTYVSALISEAMSLTQAGDGGTASRYLEQAIAELRTNGAAQPTYADGG
ncbi:MAG: hypothetical protein JO122_10250 [Acetobacteraceae bacterium]|nr:hypothetical protein [Acetobacteraceae bacterium]